MTLDSQQPVPYSYDPLNHPTQISQGTSSVSFGYDAVGHRTSLTLPNSVVTQYAYDAAGHVTGMTYQFGGTTLGSLSYSYDADGKITQKVASFAATNLPIAFFSAFYNANNQLTVRGANGYTFDLNSNLKTDGVNTYNWEERNQLNSITGDTTASFAYDALQRRVSNLVAGLSTSFLYDQNQVIEELAGGTPVANLPDWIGSRRGLQPN
jgi:YD repeat-containing protein